MAHAADGIDPAKPPSGDGCAECLNAHGWWVHLRRCAQCGHIGCCDSSPSRHATAHFHATGHPVIASFEPGEEWLYDYRGGEMIPGTALAPPRWHLTQQPVPGPHGNVPPNWRSLLAK